VKIAFASLARHHEFVFRWNRDINSNAKRIAAFLVFLGLLYSEAAADDMVANPFELSSLVMDKIFNGSSFVNVTESYIQRDLHISTSL
jgi:hypothetical protein